MATRSSFKSDHLDWCFISTIEKKCFVHTLPTYQVQRMSMLQPAQGCSWRAPGLQ